MVSPGVKETIASDDDFKGIIRKRDANEVMSKKRSA